MINNQNYKNIFIAILALFAFLERILLDLGPNFELITTAAILSLYYLGKKRSLLITFLIIAATDRLIGNTDIFLFTWTGFLIPIAFLSGNLNRFRQKLEKLLPKISILSGLGITTNLFFFIWTNAGVWLLDSWGMYTKDFKGLVNCYINALPFLRNQITSSLIFIPTFLILFEISLKLADAYNLWKLRRISQVNKSSQ